MKWITSANNKTNQYVELDNGATITVANRYNNGYAFAVRFETSKDESSYSREYRTKAAAKQAAVMAMRDLKHWQPDFPQWRLSRKGNFHCLVEGEVCFTVFQADGFYKIWADDSILNGTYANETGAMSAVTELLNAISNVADRMCSTER